MRVTVTLMSEDSRWILYALLGALFAAVTNVLSKPALEDLDVAVANAVRAGIMLGVLATVATVQGRWWTLAVSPRRGLVLIVLAGVAAAASWLFGYRALQLASVSKSYPIDKLSAAFAVVLAVAFLGERPSLTNWIGIAVMIAGGYLVTRPSS